MRLILSLLASCLLAVDPITIDKRPPTTQRVIVDNPSTMPAHHEEHAWCRFFFNCSVQLKYDLIDRQQGDGKCVVTAQAREVQITLTLEDTLFLPRHSTEKLNAHDGHRRINERVYENAEDAARIAAKDVMSKTWQGVGTDEDAAGKDATDKAVKELCNQYLNATAERALRLGRVYDELTNHGRRMRPTENEAIEKAFELEKSKQ